MNNYLDDSGLFFKNISKGIDNNIQGFDIINLIMIMALGLEKLLKGILFDLNPTFVLIDPVFKNSIQILYKDRLLKEPYSNSDLPKHPSGDVITFRNSILRAQTISKTTYSNKNVLFNLSDARDIIAHCELEKLDLEKYKTLLLRDFYPLLKSYSDELKIKRGHFFSGSHIRLANISSKLQEDLESKMELILDAHQGKWKSLRGNVGYVEEKTLLTTNILKTPNKEKVECPACGNDAVLYLKPIVEYNPFVGTEIQIGNEILKIKCQFCKLELADSKKFDLLGIIPTEVSKPSLCAHCGDILAQKSDTGLCEKCDENHGTKK